MSYVLITVDSDGEAATIKDMLHGSWAARGVKPGKTEVINHKEIGYSLGLVILPIFQVEDARMHAKDTIQIDVIVKNADMAVILQAMEDKNNAAPF